MKPTINKAKEIFDRIKSNDADKGYDAEYNHKPHRKKPTEGNRGRDRWFTP